MKESEIEVFVWRNTAPNKKEEQLIYCVQNLILDSLGHNKLALEETSKMAMTHWKSVIAEAKKNLAHTLKPVSYTHLINRALSGSISPIKAKVK